MEIIVADKAGFCFGVNRAMDLALEAGEEKPDSVYTLGPLIHNPQAVEKLTKAGIKQTDNIDDVGDDGVVVIRSHGVPPGVIASAEQKEIDVVDATCPFVKRAQQKVQKLKEAGYTVIISGDKNHPEVRGILGHIDNQATVIEDESDFDELPKAKKIGIVAQTTQSVDNLRKLVNHLLGEIKQLEVHNTICNTTEQRQEEAAVLAQKVDVMIVIGGYNSANTNRLAKICQENGAKTFHIESAEELQLSWFKNIKKVGITAGASTPNWIIKEVVKRMTEEIKEQSTESEELFARNEIVTGVVKEVTEEGVLLDLDGQEGFVPVAEFESETVNEDLTPEDELECFVINPDKEGQVLLSAKKAKAWRKVEELHEANEIIEAEIAREVKGGLVVDIGLRGFIPASHVAIEYVEDLSDFVGETMELQIIEVERENNNVVLSHKVILEAEESKKKQEVLDSLEIGETITGEVTKLVDFGAFVELGGIEGLLHISEISWDRIEHPSVVLEEGEEIEVKILDINKEEERISLGLKQTQPDPWEKFVEAYEVGDIVEGKITNTVEFGAFMEIESGVEGLIHISEISHEHIAEVEDVLETGDKAKAKIINIDLDDKRVGLSLKELEEKKSTSNQQQSNKKSTAVQEKGEEGIAKIGDVFGDLFNE